MQRPKRPASAEIPNDAAAIDHVYERLNLIVAALVYAEGEARVLGSEETIHKTTAVSRVPGGIWRCTRSMNTRGIIEASVG